MGSVIVHLERAILFLNRNRDGIPKDPYMARSEIENALHHYKVETESKKEKKKV